MALTHPYCFHPSPHHSSFHHPPLIIGKMYYFVMIQFAAFFRVVHQLPFVLNWIPAVCFVLLGGQLY